MVGWNFMIVHPGKNTSIVGIQLATARFVFQNAWFDFQFGIFKIGTWKVQLIHLIAYKIQKLLYFKWSPPWHLKTATSDFMSATTRKHRSDIRSDISDDIRSDTSTDIRSDIFTDILSDIPSDISFGILSDILSDIFTDILSDILTYLLTFFLTYLLTFYLTFFLTHLLTFFLTSCLTYLLTFFLTYLLTFYLTFFLTHLLTFFLTSCLTYSQDLISHHIFRIQLFPMRGTRCDPVTAGHIKVPNTMRILWFWWIDET